MATAELAKVSTSYLTSLDWRAHQGTCGGRRRRVTGHWNAQRSCEVILRRFKVWQSSFTNSDRGWLIQDAHAVQTEREVPNRRLLGSYCTCKRAARRAKAISFESPPISRHSKKHRLRAEADCKDSRVQGWRCAETWASVEAGALRSIDQLWLQVCK